VSAAPEKISLTPAPRLGHESSQRELGQTLLNSSGKLAMFPAIHRASSRVSSLAAKRRHISSSAQVNSLQR
jgi:hypothetical protein